MLSNYFKDSRTLKQLSSGPTGPYLDGFANHLHLDGYASETARRYLRAAVHIGLWGDTVNCLIEDLNEASITTFASHLPFCACNQASKDKSPDIIIGAKHFFNYLGESGVIRLEKNESLQSPHKPLFEDFCKWMKQHRGVTDRTLEIYKPAVVDLLNKLGDNPQQYQVQDIRYFVFNQLKQSGKGKGKNTVSALRMFLRFLSVEGLCSTDLHNGIPRLADWRLSSLPRYLPSADVECIINICDTSTPIGLRDRAILLLLARLGLRGGDIAALKLNDINWEEGSIRFLGKGRYENKLPLPQEIGDAVLKYLQDGRPSVNDEHVFIRAIAPLRRFGSGSTVSRIVAKAIRKAGISSPSFGAHVLRHSAATAMLRQGVSLNDIAAILRHRSIETTAHYAKVDLALLCEVAQPWPEVESC
jgi:integrase/recombinase XerD